MKHKQFLSLSVAIAAALATAVGAAPAGAKDAVAGQEDASAAVEQAFLERLPEIGEVEAKPSRIDNVYEVAVNGTSVYYTSPDARYVIQGDMIDLETRDNVTELRRSGARLEVLAALKAEDTIRFAPQGKPVQHEITVFTDIDCGYCRKLHREIDQINDLGIAVRYAFFPRSGPNTPSWKKAQEVACADDPNVALTMAKAGEQIEAASCETDAVVEGWSIGRNAGVTGTPAIVTESGYLIGGYLPAPQLKARLDQIAAEASRGEG